MQGNYKRNVSALEARTKINMKEVTKEMSRKSQMQSNSRWKQKVKCNLQFGSSNSNEIVMETIAEMKSAMEAAAEMKYAVETADEMKK